jgi:hypothetical protein
MENNNQEWIDNGHPGEFTKPNDGWDIKKSQGNNSEVLTGNPLIDNAGIW